MSRTISDFAEVYSRAWADHDPDAIVALHTEDTVFHQHGMGDPAVGRLAVRGAVAGLFTMALTWPLRLGVFTSARITS